MTKNNIRRIKIQSRYRAVGGVYLGTPGHEVPWLSVSGKWLGELGFKVGERVRITTREKLLIIEPLEGEAKAEQDCKAALQQVKQTLKELAQ